MKIKLSESEVKEILKDYIDKTLVVNMENRQVRISESCGDYEAEITDNPKEGE